MVSARAGGVRARLASLAAVVGLLLGGLVGAPPAHAAEPVALVSITLKTMEPAVPDRDGEITVTGTVKNITDQPLFRLKAIFWRNQAPITDREGFDQALVSESNDPLGTRKIEVFQELFTEADPNLDPGETADFTLTARVADLELAPTDGIYLMGVHVLQAGNVFAVGRARVFVPLVAEEVPEPLQLSTLVVLSSRPSLVREGVLSDEHLAREIGPKGRLTRLLKAADRAGTSFAIDPALITELQSDAGRVRGAGRGRWRRAGHRSGRRDPLAGGLSRAEVGTQRLPAALRVAGHRGAGPGRPGVGADVGGGRQPAGPDHQRPAAAGAADRRPGQRRHGCRRGGTRTGRDRAVRELHSRRCAAVDRTG